MASRCCGNRLSLPNQYDTQTPRASLSSSAARKPRYFRAVRRPPRDLARDRLASRITCTAWVSKCPWRNLSNFGKEKFRIRLQSSPDRRTVPSEPRPSPRKRNTRGGQAASRPQVQVPPRHWRPGILHVGRDHDSFVAQRQRCGNSAIFSEPNLLPAARARYRASTALMATPISSPLRLALIGMSGTGKTFWSKRLAEAGRSAFCCDDRIEQRL